MAAAMAESTSRFCSIADESEVTSQPTEDLKCHSELMIYVEKATDCLLLRDFEKCISECRHGINFTKQKAGDVDSMGRLLSTFTVILIQAYAELDRWREVLPIITHEFQGIEDCPYQVIQLLVLLHARVEEFAQCHAIASIWLKTEEKRKNNEDYKIIVQTYLIHVLVRQNKWQEVTLFLKSCSGLQREDMEKLIKFYNELKILSERSALEEKTKEEKSNRKYKKRVKRRSQVTSSSDFISSVSHYVGDVLAFVQRFGVLITSRLRYVNLSVICKIIFVGVCAYLITLQATNGDLMINLGRVFLITQGMKRAISSLLWPRSASKTDE